MVLRWLCLVLRINSPMDCLCSIRMLRTSHHWVNNLLLDHQSLASHTFRVQCPLVPWDKPPFVRMWIIWVGFWRVTSCTRWWIWWRAVRIVLQRPCDTEFCLLEYGFVAGDANVWWWSDMCRILLKVFYWMILKLEERTVLKIPTPLPAVRGYSSKCEIELRIHGYVWWWWKPEIFTVLPNTKNQQDGQMSSVDCRLVGSTTSTIIRRSLPEVSMVSV